MKKKIIPFLSIVIISTLAILFFIDTNTVDKKKLQDAFFVDAIYFPEQNIVEISFEDKTKQSSKIVLEILGMPESFQRVYFENQFVERVEFFEPPKYGWKTTPVTFVIDHEEFNKIALKTEIHSFDEPPRPIIYGSP